MFQLTKGSLRRILDGEQVADPILQILQMKNIQNNQDGITRYKVSLFDGDSQHTFGILATQNNHLVEKDELKVGSVIRLEEFAVNVLSKDPPKVVVILLNFEILGEMDTKTPSSTSSSSNETTKPVQNENIEPEENKPSNAKKFFNNKDSTNNQPKANAGKLVDQNASTAANSQPGMFNGFKVFGISSLNPYQNKWSIKARCTNKSTIRTWSNAKGEGKLFSVEFIDNTGEIRATGFNEQCDKFYDMLNIDNVYYISRGSLKPANKQYSKLNNDYEMTFNNETCIEQCHETDNLPHINISLCPLSEICNKNANDSVDVIGVVKSCGDRTSITVKSTGKELSKREVVLVDDSNYSISATLWGKTAEDFDGSENPVILLKGAKVGEYNGKNLSVGGATVMQINPDIPESFKLRGWFDNGGCDGAFTELSNTGQMSGGGSTGGGMTQSNWKTLDSLKLEQLGMHDKPDYITCKAIVLYCKKDNSMYMACPTEGCNKKVVDQNDGQYRCEKCNKSSEDYKWRFVMSANIADYTDSSWITCFQESSELMLGIKADELGALKNDNSTKFDEYFSESVFREFNFKLRIKMENYNDESRVKVGVTSAEPVNYVTNGRLLLQKIKAFAKSQC